MTGPDELRVGDAERTRVTEALHDHFAQGRLTRDELDERLDATLSAKTFGDLHEITRDLPGPAPVAEAAPPAAQPYQGGRGHRPRLPFLPIFVGVFLAVALLSGGTMWALFGVLKVIFIIWLVMALVGFVHVRRWRRHGRRFGPPGPPSPPWQGPRGPWQGPYGPYGRRSRGRRRHGPWDW